MFFFSEEWFLLQAMGIFLPVLVYGFSGGAVVKDPPASAGDTGSVPGLGRSPGEGKGYPLQYSWLGYPMDRGAWQATVHGVAKSWTQLSMHTSDASI